MIPDVRTADAAATQREVAATGAEAAVRIPDLARPAAPRRPPRSLAILAALVAAGMLLPIAYLLIRVAEVGPAAVEFALRPRTLQVLLNKVGLVAVVTTVCALIAVPLAWLLVRTDLPGRRAWTALAVLPLVMPSYVAAFAVIAALGPRGLVQQALAPLGVERLPDIYGLPGAALTLIMVSYPYILLSVRAALQSMDPSLDEAARSLGHGGWSTFRRVTWPHLRPALAAGALLVALYTLSDFGAVSLLQYNAFTRVIYLQYSASFDRALAAVLALMLVALTGAALILEVRARGAARHDRTSVGVGRAGRRVRLGPWTAPALLFVGGVVGLALVMPLLVVIYWAVEGVGAGEALGFVAADAVRSVGVSTLAAMVIVAAALPVAILAVRYPSRRTTLLERVTFTGYALPGIVIALALVFFGARYVPLLYQTLPLLLFGYMVRFLPQAVGSTRNSLLFVSPRLEEAARGLGRAPLTVLFRVTLPLVRPGLVAGAALVFLTVMKELPITLILAPIGFKTLALAIWSATSEGFFHRAAVPALILTLVSGLSIFSLLGSGNQGRKADDSTPTTDEGQATNRSASL